MPENDRKLSLHSPAGSEHAGYRWPLTRSETWDEAIEIVDTIRWVYHDFPDLRLAVENYVLNDFDPTSFDSMKQLCERYNRAVDNIRKLWSGRQPPDCIDAPPSLPLLKHILNQVYNRAVSNPEALNSYEPFSPEVYGETSFELVTEIIKHTKLSENDVFVDLGSGIGQVVLQVAAATGCKCYGIEKAEIPAGYSVHMEQEFIKWMDWYGKSYGEFELHKGDFLDPAFSEIINSATVIFVNNFAFGPQLNHELKIKFSNLADGTKIVSSHEFCPLNFRITTRNLSDIGSMMHVAELSPLKGQVSWTGKPVNYYLHVIDRGKLEKFFHRQKHPEDIDSEEESSPSCTASPCSDSGVVEGSGRVEGRRKKGGTALIGSDDSEGSSMDSSDNDFEEQIRKMKNSRRLHQQANVNSLDPPHSPLLHHPQTTTTSTTMSFPADTVPPQTQEKLAPAAVPKPHSKLPSRPLISGGQQRPPAQGGRNYARKPRNKERKKFATTNDLSLGAGIGGGAKRRGHGGLKPANMDKLFGCFQEQLCSYVQQLQTPDHQQWVKVAIEKEKLKQRHLQVVIQHLESEVSNLSEQTIGQMENSMMQLGIRKLTPAGLLVGAKSIVCHNKQLRTEMKELERELETLQGQNDFMEVLCKEQRLVLPKVPANGTSLHGLTNGEPPRVPPLPNELIASDHMTNSVPSHVTGVKRKWSQSGSRQETGRAGQDMPKQSEHMSKALEMLISLDDPANYDILTVKEPMKAGMSVKLAEQVKECEIDLERIDQELLELGPFAKDTCPPLKEEMSPIVGVPGMGLVPRLSSPPTLPYQHQQPSSRKSRKGGRQPYAGGMANKAGMAKRRSETGSASSPSLPDEREPLPPMVDRMLQLADSEAVKDAPAAKSKWRKVGSSGSPVTHSPLSNLSSKRPPGSYDANSPISDSRTPPSHAQPIPLPSSKTKAKDKVDADIDSPSMIPAASEIEMLSLYMPNSHWETIESSPLRTPEHYSPEMGRTPQSAATGGTEGTKNHDQSLGPDAGRRRDRTPLRTNSSYSTESTSSERTSEMEHERSSDRHHPPAAVSAPSSVPSPLTTSIARHLNKQTTYLPPVSHLSASSGHSSQGGGPTSGGEVRRHIVVKDGASVSHAGPYQQNTYPPRMARDHRSATPGERGDVTSPAAIGHMPPHSMPPQMTPDANHHPFMRHRRSSSSSSLRSMKPLDDRKQPTPPSHQRISSSSSSPLQQQHHMQLLGAQLPGQPNLLPPQTSSAVNPTGLPRYPFTSPFLPGGNWLSTGGVLAATGIPQLQPPMFPLDPNSPFKPVFNPALLPYRYPFGMTPPLQQLSSQGPIPPLSGGVSTAQPTSAFQSMYPLGAGANLAAFQNTSEAGGVVPGGSTAPPLLQMQALPNQQQPFPGMMQASSLLGKDDKGEDKVQGLNWMNHPALMGSGFGMMPYLMGQNQLGIGAAAGLGMPGGQPGVNLLNPNLSPNPMGGGGDGGIGKIGPLKDGMFSRKPQPSARRVPSASGDISRDGMPHQTSPSNTPPLAGGAGVSKTFPLGPAEAGKWKGMGGEQVMFGASPSATSSHFPVTSMSGHVIPIGFSPPMGNNSPMGPYLQRGRGDGLGLGSPRGAHDKMKLRIHQVRNDDFKMQVKPDRRRKRWRGKDKDILLTTRADLTDSAVRRMGVGILANEPPLMKESAPPIRALPASLGVEPGSSKMQSGPPPSERAVGPPTTSGTGDGNYALNMLADMSSIQSKEGRRKDGENPAEKPFKGHHPTTATSGANAHLRSPVSLAATSLLMLGDDLNIPTGSHAPENQAGGDVSHFESTAASSLLQLSAATRPEPTEKATAGVSSEMPPHADSQESEEPDTLTRSSRSASFSAAEAMIMMVSGNKENVAAADSQDSPSSSHLQSSGVGQQLPSFERAHSTPVQKPSRLRLDSEATDTDSEATLTPESPRSRKKFDQLPLVDEQEPSVSGGELRVPLDIGVVGDDKEMDASIEGPVNTNHIPEELQATPVAHNFTPSTKRDHDADLPTGPAVTGADISTAAEVVPAVECNAVHTEQGSRSLQGPPRHHDPSSPDHNPALDTREATVVNAPPPFQEPMYSPDDIKDPSSDYATSSSSGVESHPATPPPAKRPKFISTFGPATDDADGSNSLTPLGRGGGGGGCLTPLAGDKEETEGGEKGACSETLLREYGENESDRSLTPLGVDLIGAHSSEKGTDHLTTYGEDNTRPALASVDVDTHRHAKPEENQVANAHHSTESAECDASAESAGSSAGKEVAPLSHSSGNTVEGVGEMSSGIATAAVDESLSRDVESNDESEDPPQTSEPSTMPHQQSVAHTKSQPTADITGGASALGVSTAASAVRSPKKVKVFKRSKDGSVSAKVKLSHGKTRVIKIKRTKSPKLLAKPMASTDAESGGKDGMLAAAAATEGDKTNTAESGSVDMPLGMKTSEDTQKDDSETSRECEGALPDATKVAKVEPPLALQNRLKVNRVGTSSSSPSSEKQRQSSGASRTGKDAKAEEKRKTPKAAAPGKDLFGVDVPSKKEVKRDHTVKPPKKHKHSARGPTNSPVVHRHSNLKMAAAEKTSELAQLPRPKKVSESSIDSAPHSASSHDNNGDQASLMRDDTSTLEVEHISPVSQNHSPFEKAFSPLSDDELILKPTKESRPGKPTAEEEERKHKGRRHQPVGEESSLSSPSSSLGSMDSKKHHHHHNHRHNRPESGDGHSGKAEHRSKSSSRGPSPDRKRRHHRHHDRHHHSAHEAGRSRGDGPGSRHSSTTPKEEVPRRPYESISDDDMFELSVASPVCKDVNRRHGGTLPTVKSSGGRKRWRISSDEEDSESESVAASLESDRRSLGPSKHKKIKHSSKERKQRWKESKHKHGHKQH